MVGCPFQELASVLGHLKPPGPALLGVLAEEISIGLLSLFLGDVQDFTRGSEEALPLLVVIRFIDAELPLLRNASVALDLRDRSRARC